ncbi:MAG TPA: hypothetical protein VFX65_14200 [Candidatus Limnocylindrales bacterium]|nr:hypothetical protein [Candidatus Limnocylindrales bacterium]
MDPSLLWLMESLIAALEARDAGDAELSPSEADKRIRQLEADLALRLEGVRAGIAERLRPGLGAPMPHRAELDLVGPAG